MFWFELKSVSSTIYLPVLGFILFKRVCVVCEMQTPSSMIWTQFVVSIFNDDKHHTTYTYIISILMSRWKHRFPKPPLSHPSLPAGLLDYIICPYRSVADKFQLVVQHLHVRVKGSIGERYIWVRPYFSTGVLHVLFVLFEWFYRWEVSVRIAAVLWDVASRICSI